MVTLPFPSGAFAVSVAVQPDGGIVLVGPVGSERDATAGMAIACVDANGRPDASFGDPSRRVAPGRLLFGDASQPQVVAIQPWDQRIIIAGQRGTDRITSRLIRLDPDGTFDRTFALFGISDLDVRFQSHAAALWIRPDHGIVVGGIGVGTEGAQWSLARLRPDGIVERDWAMHGYSLGQVGLPGVGFNHAVRVYGMAPTTYDSMIVVGSAVAPSRPDRTDVGNQVGAIARFKDDGTLDPTFGEAGALLLPASAEVDMLRGLALTHNESIWTAGDRGGYAFSNPNGELSRFGVTRVAGLTGVVGYASSPLVLQSSDTPERGSQERAIIAGRSTGDDGGFGIHRFESYSSTPDASFGESGQVTTTFGEGSSASAYAMAIQPDGKLVVAGAATVDGTRGFALARYDLE